MTLPFLWREIQSSLLTQFYISLIPMVAALEISDVRHSLKYCNLSCIFSFGITSDEFIFAYQPRIDEFDTHKKITR